MFRGWREYFSYTRRQRRGLWTLVVLLLVLQVFLYWPELIMPTREFSYNIERVADTAANAGTVKENQSQHEAIKPFPFDPNKVSQKGLQKLGLSASQAQTFIKFRRAGGSFEQPEDLLQVYAVDSQWYEQVRSFVRLHPTEVEQQSEKPDRSWNLENFNPNTVAREKLRQMGLNSREAGGIISYRSKYKEFEKPGEIFEVYNIDSAVARRLEPHLVLDSSDSISDKSPIRLDLNAADSLALVKIRGVGPTTASRLIKYRELLGGFHSVSQLREVYGIDSARYQEISSYFEVDSTALRKLNLNEDSFKTLLRHPYLNYELVQNIVNFRKEVRSFKNSGELRNIELVNDVLFRKIAPYLSVNTDGEEGDKVSN